jgi:DivIVA domain-containing protein
MTSYRGEAETKGRYPHRVTGRLDVVIRGYDRLQVDRLLDRLSREMSIPRLTGMPRRHGSRRPPKISPQRGPKRSR